MSNTYAHKKEGIWKRNYEKQYFEEHWTINRESKYGIMNDWYTTYHQDPWPYLDYSDAGPHWYRRMTCEIPNRRKTKAILHNITIDNCEEHKEFPLARKPYDYWW